MAKITSFLEISKIVSDNRDFHAFCEIQAKYYEIRLFLRNVAGVFQLLSFQISRFLSSLGLFSATVRS